MGEDYLSLDDLSGAPVIHIALHKTQPSGLCRAR